MVAVVAVGLVAACGGGPAGEPTVTTAKSTTTTSSVEPAILHAGGVDAVEFGTPMDEALTVLVGPLGAPDEVERIELDEEMCCGRGEADSVGCIRLMGWATWQQLGLRLNFSDWGGDPPEPAPPRLERWEAFAAGVATVEGIGVGSTVDDLRRAYPDVHFGIEQQVPVFLVPSSTGSIKGVLDWPTGEFVSAVQQALADAGADVEVTGEWNLDEPLNAFAGTGDWGDVLGSLGLPPADVAVGSMWAGEGEGC
jgi:hypothetical protein